MKWKRLLTFLVIQESFQFDLQWNVLAKILILVAMVACSWRTNTFSFLFLQLPWLFPESKSLSISKSDACNAVGIPPGEPDFKLTQLVFSLGKRFCCKILSFWIEFWIKIAKNRRWNTKIVVSKPYVKFWSRALKTLGQNLKSGPENPCLSKP